MTSKAPDATGVVAFLVYLLLAVLLGIAAARAWLTHEHAVVIAVGLVALALAIMAGAWFGLRTSVVTVDDNGVERRGSHGFSYPWEKVTDARITRLAGGPHLVVTPGTPPRRRPVGQLLLTRRGLAPTDVAAPVAQADVAAISEILAREPWRHTHDAERLDDVAAPAGH